MNPSIARVARAHIASAADALLEQLDDLAALDDTLTAIEDSFAMHYRTAAGGPTFAQVKSHDDALKKARQGLAIAEGILAKAQEMVAAFPDDKTAKRALADANTMVGRFTRHVDEAFKVIRTLAQKQMPPALRAAASALKSAASRLLVDPDQMQAIPWIQPSQELVGASKIDTVKFLVEFKISGFTAYPGEVVFWVSETPVGASGVLFTVAKIGTAKEPGQVFRLTSIATAVSRLEPIFRGVPAGQKGTEKPAPPSSAKVTITNAELAEKVARAVTEALRKHLPDAKMSAVVSRKEGTFIPTRENGRTYGAPLQVSLLFWSGTGARDEIWYGRKPMWEYRAANEEKVEKWRKVLEPYIAPYKGHITTSIDWTLKGEIITTVVVGKSGVELLDDDDDYYDDEDEYANAY